jgi:uncharacterized membrane protein
MRWEHTATIDAPADLVWGLAVDVTDWPTYMPTMRKVERLDDGPFRLGSSARVVQPAQTPATWTVTEFAAGQAFAWQTKRMGMTMTGEHRVTPDGAGCRNQLAIRVEGGPARILGPLLGPLMKRTIATENAAIKARAEAA